MTQVNFTTSDTWVVPAGITQLDNLLKVAGGGGGGCSLSTRAAGGGGAGGVVHETSVTVVPGETLTITVGTGGAGGSPAGTDVQGSNGTNTTVVGSVSGALGVAAVGGGGGGPGSGSSGGTGANGGSGGGGGCRTSGGTPNNNGLGTAGQGNNGGDGNESATSPGRQGGGGGGAGATGGNAWGSGQFGGDGVDLSATFGTGVGEAGWFGGGGGGGNNLGTAPGAAGGNGGGGDGSNNASAQVGMANTGGGGGGGKGASNAGRGGGTGFVSLIYTPIDPPGVPTSVTATPAVDSIDLDWAAPATGGTPTGYEVRIDGGAPEDVGDVLTHLFDLLDPETTYTVEVRAYNAGGESDWVDVETATLAVPPTPTPGQHFDTADVLRLEVEGDPPEGKVRNLLMNPDGRYGGAGWVTPVSGTITAETILAFTATDDAVAWDDVYFMSEPAPVVPGEFATARLRVVSLDASVGVKGLVGYLVFEAPPAVFGEPGATVDASTLMGVPGTPATIATIYTEGPTVVPAGAVQARIVIYYEGVEDGDEVTFDAAAIITTPTSDPVDLGIGADIVEEVDWVDVLDTTHDINVVRAPLDLGILTATILDTTLDPAVSAVLTPGRPLRLVTEDGDEPIFTGKIAPGGATVRYDMDHEIDHPDSPKTARITLTAIDGLNRLAAEPRPHGVADVNHLRQLLEGCGLRWLIEGSDNQIAPTFGPANRIDSAKAVDQIAITRDTHHGYAWIDRHGVFNAVSALPLGEDPEVPLALDENVYSRLTVTYDPRWLVNSVTLVVLSIVADEPVETRHGPFVNAYSYVKNGERPATYTVNEDGLGAVDPAEFAAGIFTTDAPTATIEALTIPIREEEDLTEDRALVDLYRLVEVTNTDRDLAVETRIVGIEHRITPRKWLMTLTLAPAAAVPLPQAVPNQ